jgi:2-polyprenyl-3-methyl-5-hydroxy-6-metoxy-1,4-benzoquinol methylase
VKKTQYVSSIRQLDQKYSKSSHNHSKNKLIYFTISISLTFQDEPGNGTFYGVAEYLSTEQRNHVKMENSDIELGDAFGSGPGSSVCDSGAGIGTTTELLEKQDTTVTLVTGGERRRSTKQSDAHGDVLFVINRRFIALDKNAY